MLKNAAKKVFLCDSDKFDTQSAYKQCTLEDVDIMVSENDKGTRYVKDNKKLVII